ncbi:MAG: LCP family protein [Clostridiales Family XIII bacterium]|nr:LCP family protein [Clostridiales Family XIII bacterium]
MNKNKGKSGMSGRAFTFWVTFLGAFVVMTLLLTPVISAFMNTRPFLGGGGDGDDGLQGTDVVILEQDFDYFLPTDSPFYEAFKNQKRLNCLLLGVKSGLTDTIMLISYNVDSRQVDVISVPRDTYYHRKGYNGDAEDKINAAYRKNPLNSAVAVSNVLLGMPINYYVVIEDKGVENIIDFIGGVPMDIEFHMKYDDPRDKPPLHIDIPAGRQVLDGKQAVQFLRYRHGYTEGDLGRVKAQQAFIRSAFKQALKTDMGKLMETVQENVVSDMPLSTMLYLVQKSIGLSGDELRTHTMPGVPMSKAPWYVYPDTKEIEALIREVYEVAPEKTTGAAVSGSALPGAGA